MKKQQLKLDEPSGADIVTGWRTALMLSLSVLLLVACGAPAAPTTTVTGLSLLATTAAPVLGVVVDADLPIVSLDAGGAAERGGLQLGDRLERIGNQSISRSSGDMQAVREIIGSNNGQSLQITVQRSGKELTLAVKPAAAPASGNGNSAATPTAVPPGFAYF